MLATINWKFQGYIKNKIKSHQPVISPAWDNVLHILVYFLLVLWKRHVNIMCMCSFKCYYSYGTYKILFIRYKIYIIQSKWRSPDFTFLYSISPFLITKSFWSFGNHPSSKWSGQPPDSRWVYDPSLLDIMTGSEMAMWQIRPRVLVQNRCQRWAFTKGHEM